MGKETDTRLQTSSVLIFEPAGIFPHKKIAQIYTTAILVRKGGGNHWIQQLTEANQNGQTFYLEFYSPVSGFTMEVPIVQIDRVPNPLLNLMKDRSRGFPADELIVTVQLTQEQLWQINPENSSPDFGY